LNVLAYLKGIQDVGVFVCFHSIFNFDIFWSNRCCLSGGPPQRAWTESMSKLNMI